MSDQDFFFDDDQVEEVVDKAEIQARKDAKKADKKARENKQASVDDSEVSGLTITATICGLIALIALLVGIIGGIFIGRALVPSAPASSNIQTGTGGMGGMGGGNAPVLTDEQMQQGMPAGHPSIDQMDTTDDGATQPDDATVDDATNPATP